MRIGPTTSPPPEENWGPDWLATVTDLSDSLGARAESARAEEWQRERGGPSAAMTAARRTSWSKAAEGRATPYTLTAPGRWRGGGDQTV